MAKEIKNLVKLEYDNGVAWVTINRPEKRNALGLSVLSSARTSGESAFANFDLKAVIIARTVSHRRIKAESVKDLCIHQTVRNRAGNVIAQVENPAAALSCEDLQRKV